LPKVLSMIPQMVRLNSVLGMLPEFAGTVREMKTVSDRDCAIVEQDMVVGTETENVAHVVRAVVGTTQRPDMGYSGL